MRKIVIHLGGRKELSSRDIPDVPTLLYPETEGIGDLAKRIEKFIMQNKDENSVIIITTSDAVLYYIRLLAKQGKLEENIEVILYDLDNNKFKMEKTETDYFYYNKQGEINYKGSNSICYDILVQLIE